MAVPDPERLQLDSPSSPGFHSHSRQSGHWIGCRRVSVTFRCCNLRDGLDPEPTGFCRYQAQTRSHRERGLGESKLNAASPNRQLP